MCQHPEPVRDCQAEEAQVIPSLTFHETLTDQDNNTQLHDIIQAEK